MFGSKRIPVCFLPGCKVESVYLGVDSVNTHRDRPEVGISGSIQHMETIHS